MIRPIIEGADAAKPVTDSDTVAPPVMPPQRQTPPPVTQPVDSEPQGEPVQQTMDLTPPPADPVMGDTSSFPPDPRIPKALRDLMINNNVCEWDIQAVVEARGYFPGDMPVYDYPEDFIQGVLVGAWPQVFAMIRDMKKNNAIPFN